MISDQHLTLVAESALLVEPGVVYIHIPAILSECLLCVCVKRHILLYCSMMLLFLFRISVRWRVVASVSPG